DGALPRRGRGGACERQLRHSPLRRAHAPPAAVRGALRDPGLLHGGGAAVFGLLGQGLRDRRRIPGGGGVARAGRARRRIPDALLDEHPLVEGVLEGATPDPAPGAPDPAGDDRRAGAPLRLYAGDRPRGRAAGGVRSRGGGADAGWRGRKAMRTWRRVGAGVVLFCMIAYALVACSVAVAKIVRSPRRTRQPAMVVSPVDARTTWGV